MPIDRAFRAFHVVPDDVARVIAPRLVATIGVDESTEIALTEDWAERRQVGPRIAAGVAPQIDHPPAGFRLIGSADGLLDTRRIRVGAPIVCQFEIAGVPVTGRKLPSEWCPDVVEGHRLQCDALRCACASTSDGEVKRLLPAEIDK